MKYIIVDDCNTEIFTSEYETAEEAARAADESFRRLTETDKKRRNNFYVLESVNPDPEAENHLDGNIIKEYM